MEGFEWSLKGGHSCINLYFPGWTLDSVGKFLAAMLGVIVLAIATEGISKYRHNLSSRSRKSDATRSELKKISLIQTGLHGLHALTGYVLMLATMTFSIELLLCVITGLVIGYFIFGGDSYSHVSTNPCCAFLEQEANERGPTAFDAPGGEEVRQENECCQNKGASAEHNAVETERTERESEGSAKLRTSVDGNSDVLSNSEVLSV